MKKCFLEFRTQRATYKREPITKTPIAVVWTFITIMYLVNRDSEIIPIFTADFFLKGNIVIKPVSTFDQLTPITATYDVS